MPGPASAASFAIGTSSPFAPRRRPAGRASGRRARRGAPRRPIRRRPPERVLAHDAVGIAEPDHPVARLQRGEQLVVRGRRVADLALARTIVDARVERRLEGPVERSGRRRPEVVGRTASGRPPRRGSAPRAGPGGPRRTPGRARSRSSGRRARTGRSRAAAGSTRDPRPPASSRSAGGSPGRRPISVRQASTNVRAVSASSRPH